MTDTKIHRFRNDTFIGMSLFGLSVVIIAEFSDWPDITLLHYGFSALLAWACAICFTDWWIYKGTATVIYAWITVLLYAIAFNDTVQFIGRWIFLYRPEHYQEFITTHLWEYRSAPKVVSLIYLVSFTIWQRYTPKS